MIDFPNKPYFYLGSYPVGLPLLLVLVQAALLVLSALFGFDTWLGWMAATGSTLPVEAWRFITYWGASQADVLMLFCFGLPLLYSSVKWLEFFWSRARILWILAGIVVLLPACCLLVSWGLLNNKGWALVSFFYPTTGVFLIGSRIRPEAMFRDLGRFEAPRKWVGVLISAIAAIILLGQRDAVLFAAFVLFSACCWGIGEWARRQDEGEGEAPNGEGNALDRLRSRLATRGKRRPTASTKSSAPPPKLLLAQLDQSEEHPAIERVDAILEKISQHGMASLSQVEKDTLRRASEELR